MISWRSLDIGTKLERPGVPRRLLDALKPSPIKIAGLNPVPDAELMQRTLAPAASAAALLLDTPPGALEPREAIARQREMLSRGRRSTAPAELGDAAEKEAALLELVEQHLAAGDQIRSGREPKPLLPRR